MVLKEKKIGKMKPKEKTSKEKWRKLDS